MQAKKLEVNFSLGNFLGTSELDILRLEVISGASGPFYGPNAFNGVISQETKDPFIHTGLEMMVRAGERNLFEVAMRYAQVFKNKNGDDAFAYKLNLYGLTAHDWIADNTDPISDSNVPADNPGRYDAVNIYGDEYSYLMNNRDTVFFRKIWRRRRAGNTEDLKHALGETANEKGRFNAERPAVVIGNAHEMGRRRCSPVWRGNAGPSRRTAHQLARTSANGWLAGGKRHYRTRYAR